MEVESLTDIDLRKMLIEYGVPAGPVTDSTRNVLQKKLSQVVSMNGSTKLENESYTVEEIITTTSSTCMEESRDVAEEYTTVKYESSQHQQLPEKYEALQHQLLSDEYEPSPSQPEDLPVEYLGGNYTPSTHSYSYARNSYPSSDNLRRRPLNTPAHATKTDHKSAFTKTETVTTCAAVEDKEIGKGGWTCWRIFVLVLLVAILLLVLVYYHMENDNVKPLPAVTAPKAATNQTG